MRVIAIDIAGYKGIDVESLPAEGLVVAFGPNSSGKTNLLEAIMLLNTGQNAARRDPRDWHDETADGAVLLEFDQADVAGSRDAQLYAELMSHKFGYGMNYYLVDLTALDNPPTGAELTALWADVLVARGSPGTYEDRTTLATALVTSKTFFVDDSETMLAVLPAKLDGRVVAAAERIALASQDVEQDRLAELAVDIVAGVELTIVEVVGDNLQAWSPQPVERIALELEPLDLARGVRADVEAIHDILYGQDDIGGWRIARMIAADPGQYDGDTWLETQDASGSLFEDALGIPSYDGTKWSRVKPSLFAAAHVLCDEANANTPSFISQMGRIAIDVLPPAAWTSNPDRLQIMFEERGPACEPVRRELRSIGAGAQRWVAASLRLAGRSLRNARRVVVDDTDIRQPTITVLLSRRQGNPGDPPRTFG